MLQEFQHFEPRMNPWVAVAALAAALPPVLFWGRIFWNARARVKEDERKELERQVRPRLPDRWWTRVSRSCTYPEVFSKYALKTGRECVHS